MQNSQLSDGAIAAFIIFGLILTVLYVAAVWRIFTKAGKPGWAALIPFYREIVLLEIVGKPIWWIFLLIFPCTAPIFGIWIINLLSKSFGQGVGFTLGLIFLSFIFYPMLAFGDYTYLGPGGAPLNFGANDYEKPFDIN
jgi:hypothetical protein